MALVPSPTLARDSLQELTSQALDLETHMGKISHKRLSNTIPTALIRMSRASLAYGWTLTLITLWRFITVAVILPLSMRMVSYTLYHVLLKPYGPVAFVVRLFVPAVLLSLQATIVGKTCWATVRPLTPWLKSDSMSWDLILVHVVAGVVRIVLELVVLVVSGGYLAIMTLG